MTRFSTLPAPAPGDVSLAALADAPVLTVFQRLESTPKGLTEPEAADRLRRYGDNQVEGPARLGRAARSGPRCGARSSRC